MNNISRVLVAFRQKHDKNLRDLAKEIGIGYTTLMRIEHGHEFDLATFRKLLEWFMKPIQEKP